ncbi:MAG: phosphoribosyltransferase [Oscillospiraceae bacterium]|nr:phosphoribosyltransferase [Oscillospiraceae bacterium]
MEHRMLKLYTRKFSLPLKVVPGHFATNHSHVNYFLDMTTLKTRQNEAAEVAQTLVQQYIAGTVVDTIVCLDGTQMIGAFLAQELTKAGFHSINAHETIYVVTPEYNSNSQLIFRDNIIPMIQDKNVLILMASVTTGITVRKSAECVTYYGGKVQGISAIFSAVNTVDQYVINSVFSTLDVPQYNTCAPADCSFCKAGKKLDALVNSFGYSKL